MTRDRPVTAAGSAPRLTIYPSLDAYAARWRAVLEGEATADGEVPAVAGQVLDRYLRLGGIAPGHEPRDRPGLRWAAFDPTSVVAFRRGDRYALFARVLAALTRRRLQELDAAAQPRPVDGLATTLVVEPGAATTELLAAAARPWPLAVMTARTEGAMAALVARTVTCPAAPRAPWVDRDPVDSPGHRLFQDGAGAVGARPVELLTLRGHSRGCCLHLPDGVYCGRDPDLADDAPIRPSGRHQLSACAQGEGCFRPDAGRARRQPVREVAADVVLVDGCLGLQVAGGQSPSEITMALAAMDGTAVAFVGSPWPRTGPRLPAPLFRALLAAGHSLGAALAVLNECVTADPASIGLFGLLGDAGLVPQPGGRAVVHEARRLPSSITCEPPCPLVTVRLAGELLSERRRLAVVGGAAGLRAVDRNERELLLFADGGGDVGGDLRLTLIDEDVDWLLRRSAPAAVRRLRAADALGVAVAPRVSALDRLLKELGRAWSAPLGVRDDDLCRQLASRFGEALGETQRAVVEQSLERLAGSFDDMTDLWRGPFEFAPAGSPRCPTCDRPGLAYRVLPLAAGDVPLDLQVCAYCGEVAGGHEDADCVLTASGPAHVLRGERFAYEVEVRNTTAGRLRGVLAACISGERHVEASFRQVEEVALEPGVPVRRRLTGVFPSPRSSADRNVAVVLAYVNGGLRFVSRNLWLRSAITSADQ
jgi:hypothetical protein